MTLLFEATWSDYEEGSHVELSERNGKLILRSDGYNVMQGDYDYEEEISQEDALELMLEWEQYED